MVSIDVNYMRGVTIAHNDLPCTDDNFTFYYDETNNIRRLHVTSDGFNVKKPECFVLGGVVHRGSPRPLNLDGFRRSIGSQRSIQELKLAHLGKGDILSLLASEKVEAFLDWLKTEQLLVHYTALDPLYWSLVDIVDAILSQESMTHMQRVHRLLKKDLYNILLADPDDIASLLHRFDYPEIGSETRAAFVRELLERLEARNNLLPEINFNVLRGVLQAGVNDSAEPLVQGEAPKTLIGSFVILYITRFCLFKHATHLLDIEPYIQARLSECRFMDGEREICNYAFVNSQAEPGIQISDILVGLLGRLFSFTARNEMKEVVAARKGLTSAQRRTLGKLNDLLDRSQAETRAFFEQVVPLDDLQAGLYFLEGR